MLSNNSNEVRCRLLAWAPCRLYCRFCCWWCRVPAHDVEGLVIRKLQAFLISASEVTRAIGQPADDAQTHTILATTAKHRSTELATVAVPNSRAYLLAAHGTVTVNDESGKIRLSKQGLRAVLLACMFHG